MQIYLHCKYIYMQIYLHANIFTLQIYLHCKYTCITVPLTLYAKLPPAQIVQHLVVVVVVVGPNLVHTLA